jgi:hypothetical protein
MQAILKLDVSGQPRGWLTLNEAVTAYARGDVLYGIGESLPPVFGGIQRLTGIRSEIVLQPIVALEGRVMNSLHAAPYATAHCFDVTITAASTVAGNSAAVN